MDQAQPFPDHEDPDQDGTWSGSVIFSGTSRVTYVIQAVDGVGNSASSLHTVTVDGTRPIATLDASLTSGVGPQNRDQTRI